MKTFLQLAVIAALCLRAFAQGPNTVLIGIEGVTVTAISSPTAVLQFGVGTTWNKVTAPKLPLIISCSGGCPALGNDPAPGVVKSLYAVQQATAYTITLSNGTKKTVPALPPPPVTTYTVTCPPFTGTLSGATLTSTSFVCTLVKQ